MPFSPGDIASLVGWWEADAGAYSDAGTTPAVADDPVQQLDDQSGSGLDLSQATLADRPVWKASVLNGHPVLRFDGTDTLTRSGVAGSVLTAGAAGYILGVLKQTGSDFDNLLLTWTDGAGIIRVYATYGDVLYFDFGEGGDLANARTNIAQPSGWDDAWHLLECWRAPDDTQVIQVDADELLSATRNGLVSSGSGTLRLGSEGGTFMTGDIAAVLWFSAPPTADERLNLQHYYNDKYALGLTLPPLGGEGALDATGGVVRWHADDVVRGRLLEATGGVVRWHAGGSEWAPGTLPGELEALGGSFYWRADDAEVVESGPFSPGDIPDLVWWYEGDFGCFSDAGGTVPCGDGDPVQLQADQGPEALDLSQAVLAERPTWEDAALNGHPVLHYDGTDTLVRTGIPGGVFGVPDEGYLIAVMRQTGTDPDNVLLRWTDGVTNFRVYATYLDSLYFDFGDASVPAESRIQVAQPPLWNDNWHLLECIRFPDGTQTIRVDGIDLTSAVRTSPMTAGAATLHLGSESGTNMTGDIAAVLFYGVVPTVIERAELRTHFIEKYALGALPDVILDAPPARWWWRANNAEISSAAILLATGGGFRWGAGPLDPDEAGSDIIIGISPCVPDMSPLEEWQQIIYNHAVQVWRFDMSFSQSRKALGPRVWGEPLYDCLPCRIVRGISVKAPQQWALVESDNMFTYDELHFHLSADLRPGDVIQIRNGEGAGDYFEVLGDDKPADLFAMKKSIRMARTERAPTGVS